jgi:catechol 2,3-dioxygenase-like lactoylglutathione lyase family enzyme
MGPFAPLRTSNGVTIDFVDAAHFEGHHCAFLVTEQEFESALARLRSKGVVYYADFMRKKPGEINQLYGGRGLYFDGPEGHLFEIITQPYGPTPEM